MNTYVLGMVQNLRFALDSLAGRCGGAWPLRTSPVVPCRGELSSGFEPCLPGASARFLDRRFGRGQPSRTSFPPAMSVSEVAGCTTYWIVLFTGVTRSPSGGEGWRAASPPPTGCCPPAAGGPWGLRQAAWPPRAGTGVCGETKPPRTSPPHTSCYLLYHGRVKRTVAPWPGVLSAQMRPPWASTMRRAMARPRPAPPLARAREGSAR